MANYNGTYSKMIAGLKDLVDNPTPRVPVVLCLDVSGSMYGEPIEELNRGAAQYLQELRDDELVKYSAETAVVTFSSEAKLVTDFDIADNLRAPSLYADGNTFLGEGLTLSLDLLEKRKEKYKAAGIDYYQPILVVMSDGYPNGDNRVLKEAQERIMRSVNDRRLTVIAVGIGDGADMNELSKVSPKNKPFKLEGLKFREFFAWLSQSVASVSASYPGEEMEPDLEELSKMVNDSLPEDRKNIFTVRPVRVDRIY